jgi:phage N-6-adenine-methyltransferase
MSDKKQRQCWRTPDDFFSIVDAEFQFDIDVAADKDNAKCSDWIDDYIDAMKANWFSSSNRSAWCNPGFSRMEPWIDRAINQALGERSVVACVLGLVSPSTAWWAKAADRATEIRLLSPRMQFDPPPGVKRSSNARENALFVFRWKPAGAPQANIWTWRWK